ncbi:putative ribonuclease H-like domain-containing protein [Tanacetum coccineum]
MTHPHLKGNFVPKAILMKSSIKILNTVVQNFSKIVVSVNTAYQRPTVNSVWIASNVFSRAHTHVRRPFNKSTTKKNSNLKEKVNTVKGNVTTAGPKAVVSNNKGNEANVVKALACWVWRLKQKVLDHLELKEKGVIDSGCSRHMTGNKSYLSYYEEIDGGFVAFGGDPKGGRITGKGKISTGKLDFEDVYFVKELKFNLFNVSQMCDKKNSVIFTDTECVVLSPDFKLLDETHVLLRVPRKDNMYSVDLKNIVPSEGLTCLFSKATLDESNLWHKRLGHINFKTLNKLVRGNLVRGLPLKIFENNHTCVACQKGKQHKASCKTKIAKAVNIACYVQNRVLVIKPHNKTPYELLLGRKPTLNFMRPFRCPVTILNTLDHLGNRPNWLFDIDALTISMNYKPVVAGNKTNGNAGTKEKIDARQDGKKIVPDQKYILLPLLTSNPLLSKSSKDSPDAGFKPSREEEKMNSEHPENEDSEVPNTEEPIINQEHDANVNSTNNINTISPTVNVAEIENNVAHKDIIYGCIDDPNMPNLEEIVYYDDDEEVGAEAGMNNLATTVPVSPILTTRVHKGHPLKQIIGDIQSAPQTRRMTKSVTEHVEPKKLSYGKRAIGTKWVYRNKKDDRGIVVRNKARLVAQGYTQEEGIDYDEVFAPIARIKAIRLFLAYASFMNFIIYQMDVKSAFLYGTIEEEVYVCQPLGFEDPEFPNKFYKVEKALYGLHQTPRAWKDKDDILLVQVYVDDIIFGSTKRKMMESALLKDEEAADVDVYLYKSMIGSLMYLTARLDIMFAVYTCAMFQVTPKTSHLHAVKRIFRYLKGHPKLGLWYPRDSSSDLEAFSYSDYAGASLDRKSTIGVEYVDAANCYGQSSGPIPFITYETVIKEWEDRMESVATTISSLVAEQDSAKEISSLKKRVKQLEKRRKPKASGLKRLRKVGSASRVESSNDVSLGAQEDASKQGRKIADLNADVEVTLIDETQERFDEEMLFDVQDDLQGKEVVAEKEVAEKEVSATNPVTIAGEVVTTASATTTVDELTLAQTLIEIKAAKPKAVTTADTTITTVVASIRPKAKGIVFHD